MNRILVVVALVLGGCTAESGRHGGGTGPGGGGAGGDGTGGGNGGTAGGTGTGGGGGQQMDQGCGKMDILFIVDDSGSMSEEQTNLAANFPKFIDVLNAYMTSGGAPLDYHVGLTTTSLSEGLPPLPIPIPIPMGDDGALRNTAGCGLTRAWVERTDANPAMEFSCVAKVGTDGSGQEQPLNAAKLALTDRIADGKNKGFMRDDALLAVVMLTDEDDQSGDPKNAGSSPLPVDDFIKAFDTVKNGHDKWATAAIAGPTNCMSAFGSAQEAKRLKEFVMKSGQQAVFSSICEGDLAKSLDDALHTFKAACESFPPIGRSVDR
jgi:hypothetical protein